jgi:hypothetical protein
MTSPSDLHVGDAERAAVADRLAAHAAARLLVLLLLWRWFA